MDLSMNSTSVTFMKFMYSTSRLESNEDIIFNVCCTISPLFLRLAL